jgi:hypothetical protein
MRKTLSIILLTMVLLGTSPSTAWAAPLVQEPASDLSSFGKIIGVLGIFAAMMAVLALGTEVVVDTLKFFVGLKRKPIALEALDQLGNKLPGQLRELGVSSKAITQLEGVTEAMKDALAPLKRPAEITKAVRDGDLQTAIEKASEWADGKVDKKAFVEALKGGIRTVAEKLSIDKNGKIVKQIEASLDEIESEFKVENAVEKALEFLHGKAPELSEAWLRGKIGVMAEKGLEEGRKEIMALFKSEAQPELEGLGLDEAAIGTIHDQIDGLLEKATGHLHLDALTQLLQGVENRRFEVQSPLRKLWRRLRRSEFPALAVVNLIDWRRGRQSPKQPPLQKGNGADRELYEKINRWQIGRIFEYVERFWNFVLGRTPPEGVGLDEAQPVQALMNTTAARRLLEYDSKHKDEEASRLRVLRIISVVVGVYLAYMLQVDAIKLLAPAFDVSAIDTVFTDIVGKMRIALPEGMTAGVLLSGFAASAGSAFWHDQLGKLRVAKKAVEQVETVVETVKQAQGE